MHSRIEINEVFHILASHIRTNAVAGMVNQVQMRLLVPVQNVQTNRDEDNRYILLNY